MLLKLGTFLLKPYIIIFIGIILTAVAEILRSKTNKGIWLLVLGLLISGFGGVLSAFENDKFEKTIQGNITGGDSYSYVIPHFDMYGIVNFTLMHEGDYPLYEINVLVCDITKRSELVKKLGIHKDFTDEEWSNLQKNRDIIGEIIYTSKQSELFRTQLLTFHPRSILSLFRLKLPNDKDEQKYLIKISARNGTITQPIKFKKINGEWDMSTRVQKYDAIGLKTIELKNMLSPEVSLKEEYAGEC